MGSVELPCIAEINGSPFKSALTLKCCHIHFPLLLSALAIFIIFFQENRGNLSSIHSLHSQVNLQIPLAYSIMHIYLHIFVRK